MKSLRRNGMLDVRVWLVAMSLAAIVAINAGLALVVNRYVVDRILLHEGEVAKDFLDSIIGADAGRDRLFATPAPSPELQAFSRHVRSLPGLVRANIYSPDGFIRYSTESKLVGLKFGDNDALEESFDGNVVSKLETLTEADQKNDHLALSGIKGGAVIEAYIPVSAADGSVAAVVEFYEHPEEVQRIISDVTRFIWIAAGLGGLVLFVTLFGVIAAGTGLGRRRGVRPS